MWLLNFVLLFLINTLGTAEISELEIDPMVTTEYGAIEGFNYLTPEEIETELFLGIPFAQPPIGELRFEKPQPPKPWTIPLKAKALGPQCAAFPLAYNPQGQEDCFYLNIIKPAKPSEDPSGYPVLVWIHGGAFLLGSASDYNHTIIAERIVSQNVIFISFNYRLGPFGFFTTGDSEAPGNYGLWDQVEALKFIQKVIPNFGGNPKKVTIWGESAGGVAVSYLTLSPAAKNLFSQAISMSGTAIAPWTYSNEIIHRSRLIIEGSGCAVGPEAKKCLKEKSIEEIQQATSQNNQYHIRDDEAQFHPIIDGDFIRHSDVKEAIKDAPKINQFMGMVSQEYIPFAFQSTNPDSKLSPIPLEKASNFSRDDFIEIVRNVFGTKKAFGENASKATEKIVEFYETQKSQYLRNKYLQLYVQLFSDVHFNIAIIREAKLKAAAGQNVYFYVYNFVPKEVENEYIDGIGHAYELSNFFGPVFGFPSAPLEGTVAEVQKLFVDLIVNFAKNGKPSSENANLNPEVVTSSKTPAIEIKASTEVLDDLWADRVAFWDTMAKEFGYDWIEDKKPKNHDEL